MIAHKLLGTPQRVHSFLSALPSGLSLQYIHYSRNLKTTPYSTRVDPAPTEPAANARRIFPHRTARALRAATRLPARAIVSSIPASRVSALLGGVSPTWTPSALFIQTATLKMRLRILVTMLALNAIRSLRRRVCTAISIARQRAR